MAIALTVSEKVRRGDVFFVNPFDVETKNDLRGRWKAPPPEAILEKAMSMYDMGQIQAVEARRMADNRPILTLGFTRCAAARLIRDGFTGTDGLERRNPEFMLKVAIVESNERAAFERNIVENAQRNETSPIDDAHNHQKLRDQYGYSDADIARLYGQSNQNKVSRYRRLLSLSDDVQLLVHDGKLGVQAALDLLDLPEDQRATAITAATTANGNVNGAEIASQVRDHHLSDDLNVLVVTDETVVQPTAGAEVTTSTPTRGTKPLTHREVKKFYLGLIKEEGQDEAIVAFAKDMLAFHNGKKSVRAAKNAIGRLLEAKAAKR